MFTFAVLGALYMRNQVLKLHKDNQVLNREIGQARKDLIEWKEKNSSLIKGLSIEIDSQLESWGLSSAEKEVALLLLKGLSLKEIADIRGTSEKTARHQATIVYAKSNLEGRAQLSAFFLEDLLLPASA
ncbi:MAG: hypothetical protein KDD66_16130 [Bdellovibrionales bacterium]|nr:hypothetical protein [Bdellovibrionales bacterium]